MLLAVELIATLLVGFLLGRIWQIRQLLLAEQISKRSQATDCKPSMPLDRPTKEVRPASAAALHFHSSPTAFAGRFRASHQSLQHVGGSAV